MTAPNRGHLWLSRREFLRLAPIAAGVVLAGCAPVAPSPPNEAATAPSPGDVPAWQAEWDTLVAAAKRDGSLSVLVNPGGSWPKALDLFTQAFGIPVESRGESSSTWVPKTQQERRAGLYTLDVLLIAAGGAITNLRPMGALDPIRPVIFHPMALENDGWRDGFESRFMDASKQHAFSWDGGVNHNVTVNTDVVQPDEIKSVRDIVNPKWKGKIIMTEVSAGGTVNPLTAARKLLGDGFIKQLVVDQEPFFTRELRQLTEGVVRGRYPIAFGSQSPAILQEFRSSGAAKNIKSLDLPEIDFGGSLSVMLMNKAPHPNAAKLLINWLLTRDAQMAWSKTLSINSARTDVPIVDQETAPTPGKTYFYAGKEENYQAIEDTRKLLISLVGG